MNVVVEEDVSLRELGVGLPRVAAEREVRFARRFPDDDHDERPASRRHGSGAAGISPELLHRVATIACGGLDSLPHNGAVITLLGICRLSHQESYLDIFMVSVVGPLIALALVLILGSTFGGF